MPRYVIDTDAGTVAPAPASAPGVVTIPVPHAELIGQTIALTDPHALGLAVLYQHENYNDLGMAVVDWLVAQVRADAAPGAGWSPEYFITLAAGNVIAAVESLAARAARGIHPPGRVESNASAADLTAWGWSQDQSVIYPGVVG